MRKTTLAAAAFLSLLAAGQPPGYAVPRKEFGEWARRAFERESTALLCRHPASEGRREATDRNETILAICCKGHETLAIVPDRVFSTARFGTRCAYPKQAAPRFDGVRLDIRAVAGTIMGAEGGARRALALSADGTLERILLRRKTSPLSASVKLQGGDGNVNFPKAIIGGWQEKNSAAGETWQYRVVVPGSDAYYSVTDGPGKHDNEANIVSKPGSLGMKVPEGAKLECNPGGCALLHGDRLLKKIR